MRKIISFLFAVLLTVPLFSSCSSNEGGNESRETERVTVPADTASAAETEGFDEIRDYVQDLASSVDYNGWTFTFIAKQDSGNKPVKEEETGITESDAVYFRQRDIEEYFGIDIEYVVTENGDVTAEQVVNEVTAGGSSYDLAEGSTGTTGQGLINASVIRQVDDLKYVDLDRPWWLASLRDDYSIGHRLFLLTGSLVRNNYCDASCILFNKKVTSMYGIDDAELYQCVRDGKWTLDKMIEVASAVPENVSGAGVWRYSEPLGHAYIMTSGMHITQFDEDGNPFIADALPLEVSNLADKLSPIFGDDTQTASFKHDIDSSVEDKYGVESITDLFVDNRVLFKFGYTEHAINLRKFDVQFGILPVPKKDDSQTEYCTCVCNGWEAAVYIPRSVKSVEFTDVITEAMAALSDVYLKTAYYDKILKGQSVFDLESRDMIDILFTTKVFDLYPLYSGGNYDYMGDFSQALEDGFNIDSSQFVSEYKSNAKVVNFHAKQLVKTVDKIED